MKKQKIIILGFTWSLNCTFRIEFWTIVLLRSFYFKYRPTCDLWKKQLHCTFTIACFFSFLMSRQVSIQLSAISRLQAALINRGNKTNELKIGRRPHDVSFELFKSFLAQCESFYLKSSSSAQQHVQVLGNRWVKIKVLSSNMRSGISGESSVSKAVKQNFVGLT